MNPIGNGLTRNVKSEIEKHLSLRASAARSRNREIELDSAGVWRRFGRERCSHLLPFELLLFHHGTISLRNSRLANCSSTSGATAATATSSRSFSTSAASTASASATLDCTIGAESCQDY
jgi:hypothetical protein